MKIDVVFIVDSNDYGNFIAVLENGLNGMNYELKRIDPLWAILGSPAHFMSLIKIPAEDNGYTQSSFIYRTALNAFSKPMIFSVETNYPNLLRKLSGYLNKNEIHHFVDLDT